MAILHLLPHSHSGEGDGGAGGGREEDKVFLVFCSKCVLEFLKCTEIRGEGFWSPLC